MGKVPYRRSRGQCALLAFAALAIVLLWVAADVRLRWSGLRRDVFWNAGLVLYTALLNAAIGPTIDYRDRPQADVSASGTRFSARTELDAR